MTDAPPPNLLSARRWERQLGWLSRRWPALLLASLSGVAYFVGFCGFEQFYLSWFCLIGVLWALDDESLTSAEAMLIAWLFGLVTHMGGYTWIIHLLTKFAYLPLPLAFLGYFLLCLAQGSLLGVWGWTVNRLTTRLKLPLVLVAPVLMVVAEWIYPAIFPSYLSNSQYRWTYVIQSLDLWGPLGLTFLLVLTSAVLYQTIAWKFRSERPFPTVGWAALIFLFVGNLLYGLGAVANIDDTVAHADRRIKIGMVQGNVGIYEKAKNPAKGLRRHRDGSLEVERQGVDLVVWPESGYYYPIRSDTRNVRRRVYGDLATPLLFGAVRVETRPNQKPLVYNSSFLADAEGNIMGSYDKNILLAFGEYIPGGEMFPILYEWFPEAASWDRGKHTRPLELSGVKYGVLICFEDVLPGFVRKVMDYEPHVLINLTNDAWFGDTHEPIIHLALATFRAVESRRFLARSTNTGISAFVDPAGRILSQTPVVARANLVETVALLSGRTIYTRFGDWLGLVCLLIFAYWMRGPCRDFYRFARGKPEGREGPGRGPKESKKAKRKRRRA